MSKYQRDKGKRWEQEVARRFREVLPEAEIKRGWQARKGEDAPDVDVPGWWVECKVGAAPPLMPALEQARRGCPPDRVPVAVCKRDREGPVVVLDLDRFLELVRRAGSGGRLEAGLVVAG